MFSRCLRVKDKHRPFSTRCKHHADKFGILCNDCHKEAYTRKIFVLMHKEVTKKFGIPFKNQVCVEIDLIKNSKPPVAKNASEERVKIIKNKMLEQLNILKMPKIKWYHDALKLNIWDSLKDVGNEYSFRFHMTKAIIEKLVTLGV